MRAWWVCGAVPVSGATPKDAARAPAPEANGGRGGRGHDGGRRGRSHGEGGRAASGAGEAIRGDGAGPAVA